MVENYKKRTNDHEPSKISSKSVNISLTNETKTSDSAIYQNPFSIYRAVTKSSEMKTTKPP